MKWSIDDVPIFVSVVDNQGITAAARALSMPKSTVSAALARLEAALGLRLIDRNSRSLRVTSEGETFYRQSLLILEQVRETDATIAGLNSVPSGRLTIALPPAFCQEILAPNIARFRRQYPDIEFDLIITSRPVDLVREQLDAAVVVGALDDSEMIARTLVSGSLRWVSSPAYLAEHDVGSSVTDIERHVQICEKRYAQRRLSMTMDGHATSIDLASGVTQVNDPLSVRRALLHGAGVSVLPEFYCHQQLRRGQLIEICHHMKFAPMLSRLSVVYPSRRLMSPKVRAFLDFLDEICRVSPG